MPIPQLMHKPDKKKLKKSVQEAVAKDAKKRQRWRWFFGSFGIQTDITPVDDSLQVTEQFFYEMILPCYQKSIYKLKQKRRDFCLLSSNLFYASTKRTLIVHLNQNYYDKNTELSRFVIDLKRILESNGYITVKPGYYGKTDGKRFVTRIWPTDKLITELFNHPALPAGYHVESEGELVLLREIEKVNKMKRRKDIPYRRTRYTRQLTEDLQLINDVNRRYEVVWQVAQHPPQMLMTDLHAVFAFTFEYGGRFYTRKKFGYQALYSNDRKHITINGNKTVEFDFSGLHPHLLYAAEGVQYEGDPYKVVGARSSKTLREVLKKVLLVLLNSENEVKMVKAGNDDLHKNREHYLVMKKYGLTIKGLLEKFKEVHVPIAHYFCSGEGRKLMNIDSQIARRVLLHFAHKDKCCLNVHDSFLTEQKNADELKQVMERTYQEVTAELFLGNKTYHCPVKVA